MIVSSVSAIVPFLIPILVSVGPSVATATSSQGQISSGRQSSSSSQSDGQPLQSSLSVTTTEADDLGGASRVSPPRFAEWLDDAARAVLQYSQMQDGWRGDGSLAPSQEAIADATKLLSQFAVELPDIDKPKISADDEGAICFFRLDAIMMATVFVYGDGTYSFYAEGFDDPARSDSEDIGSPLPAKMVAAMTKSFETGLIAA